MTNDTAQGEQKTSSAPELGTILYLAEGRLPSNTCEPLIELAARRAVVGANRARTIGAYFVPGEGKIVAIFAAENLLELLHALYRVPNIEWTVKPVADLQQAAQVGEMLRRACLSDRAVIAAKKE
ncbi:MAG: hypothetical protein OMOMHJEC_03288 [Xanthomonadales bacterium]|nr:hypothetical protein [Xanthomonadales bacterium]